LQTIGSFDLHHDNVPEHAELSVCKFLAKKCISVLPQASYSPALSPYGFYLFPKLKSRVKGSHFQTLDSVQKAVTDAVKTLKEADFQSCQEAWKILWAKCVATEDAILKGVILI
jgi:hypothetical protein